jgi:hypothetical protein
MNNTNNNQTQQFQNIFNGSYNNMMSIEDQRKFYDKIKLEILKEIYKIRIFLIYFDNILFLVTKQKRNTQLIKLFDEFKIKINQEYTSFNDFFMTYNKLCEIYSSIYDNKHFTNIIELIKVLLKNISKKNTNVFFINENHCRINKKTKTIFTTSSFCRLKSKKSNNKLVKNILEINNKLYNNLLDYNKVFINSKLDIPLENMLNPNFENYKNGQSRQDNSFFNIFFNVIIIRLAKIVTNFPSLINELLKKLYKANANDKSLIKKYKQLDIFRLVTIDFNNYLAENEAEICRLLQSILNNSKCKDKEFDKNQCINFRQLMNISSCNTRAKNNKNSLNIETEMGKVSGFIKQNMEEQERNGPIYATPPGQKQNNYPSSATPYAEPDENNINGNLKKPNSILPLYKKKNSKIKKWTKGFRKRLPNLGFRKKSVKNTKSIKPNQKRTHMTSPRKNTVKIRIPIPFVNSNNAWNTSNSPQRVIKERTSYLLPAKSIKKRSPIPTPTRSNSIKSNKNNPNALYSRVNKNRKPQLKARRYQNKNSNQAKQVQNIFNGKYNNINKNSPLPQTPLPPTPTISDPYNTPTPNILPSNSQRTNSLNDLPTPPPNSSSLVTKPFNTLPISPSKLSFSQKLAMFNK